MKIVTAWLQQNDWTGHTLALCLLFCLFFLYHFSSFHFQALNSRSSYSVTGVFFGSWHDWLTNIARPVTQKHDRMCAWVHVDVLRHSEMKTFGGRWKIVQSLRSLKSFTALLGGIWRTMNVEDWRMNTKLWNKAFEQLDGIQQRQWVPTERLHLHPSGSCIRRKEGHVLRW